MAWIHQPMLRAPSRGTLDESRPEAAALIARPSFQDLDSGRFFQLKVLRHMFRGRQCVPAAPVHYPSFCSRPAARGVTDHAVQTCPCRDTASFWGCFPRTAVSRDRLASLLGIRWHNVPLLTRRRPSISARRGQRLGSLNLTKLKWVRQHSCSWCLSVSPQCPQPPLSHALQGAAHVKGARTPSRGLQLALLTNPTQLESDDTRSCYL